MTNPHVGLSLESFLEEDGTLESATLKARVTILEAALRDARTYIEASSLNITSKDGRRNYRGCLARIDAALTT